MIITVARSLYRGESSHHHHTNDEVLGVMGADFSLAYFYRLVQAFTSSLHLGNVHFCRAVGPYYDTDYNDVPRLCALSDFGSFMP